jgi:peptidoglycan-N-acetylmuramic acid deacetylase
LDNIKNKKFAVLTKFLLIAAAFMLAVNAVLNVSAQEKISDNKIYSWYCLPQKNNVQPAFDIDLDDIKNYGAYAIGGPGEKVIYLTFDFGYENGNVKKCLDALNKHNVKGAFFILDNVLKTHPELIKEMAETGHIVANHTMKHKNMCNIKDFNEYQKELIGLEELFEETTGYKLAKYYRPPKGEFTKQNLEFNHRLGYKTVFWSLAYKDWDNSSQPDKTQSTKKILDRTHNGAVVLLHPTSATNAAIMETLIQEWTKLGYRFGTLDELTG